MDYGKRSQTLGRRRERLLFGGIDAANNAAERALRPAVIARKTLGGNRSPKGAKTQQILSSILRTCQQQGEDAFARITRLLSAPSWWAPRSTGEG